ncbi:(3S,6E)-nerolidol synthase 1-like [Quercus robur]|uniref:(3S,6E)-nerolidol synthase 1-like n=1 Tax=Quercus robur TaxID=38942 RepID=UPI002163884E|nr:(3S,6E)-nerolidol synthase 1-like [Quercus robur]
MALSIKPLFASYNTPNAPKRIPKATNSDHFSQNSLPSARKLNIAHDHTLPLPLKHHNYRSKHDADKIHSQHAQKLKEVKHVLNKAGEDPLEGLYMIDAIQRLGIDYHFQEEIETILQRQNMISSAYGYNEINNQPYETALRFRLLRQDGYYVSSALFNNFKDKERKFKSSLVGDIKGLIGLYEASQLSIEGEDILDEAGEFSRQYLTEWATHLDHQQAILITDTLKNPHHKSQARFTTKNIQTNIQGTNEWINVVQELAQIDSNMVHEIHQKEIHQILKWWKDLGLANELKFARDQPLKWYMWPMACLTDPILSEQRVELTKPLALLYIIDDIFDVRGTLDELKHFTEVVNRWELDAAEQLPDYMKICFKALYDITNEICYKVYKKHGWNPLESLKKTWARLCNAFLIEAQWLAHGIFPKTEEYLKNALISTGVHMVLVHTFFFLGQGITNETVDLLDDVPGIISSTAKILRLWDDLGSAKDENQDGRDGSYLKCYMKEHCGSSIKDTREHIISMISDEWKCLNKECLYSYPFPASFKNVSLNAARMIPLMYNYDDNHRLPSLEEHMKSLLIGGVVTQQNELTIVSQMKAEG